MRDDGFLESEPTNDVALLLLDRQVGPDQFSSDEFCDQINDLFPGEATGKHRLYLSAGLLAVHGGGDPGDCSGLGQIRSGGGFLALQHSTGRHCARPHQG